MYDPTPIDTSDVVLPEGVAELAELLAANTHAIWAKKRTDQGWRCGAERNDEKKTTPCLVPYGELPESEKEYDRATALETVRLIVKLGYRIEKL